MIAVEFRLTGDAELLSVAGAHAQVCGFYTTLWLALHERRSRLFAQSAQDFDNA
jgi:hypothetical protein